MKKKILHQWLVGVLVMLAASCTGEDVLQPDSRQAESMKVAFTITMGDPSAASRADIGTDEAWSGYDDENANETMGGAFDNKIDPNQMQVFICDANCNPLAKVERLLYVQTALNTYTFTETFEASITSTTSYKIMVFANCPEMTIPTTGTLDFAASSVVTFPSKGLTADLDAIPMWGVQTVKGSVFQQDNANITIWLLRAMAKVEIALSNEMVSEGEYTLTGASFNTYNKNINSVPKGYNGSSITETGDLTTVSVLNPNTTEGTGSTLAFETVVDGQRLVAYVPEYDNSNNSLTMSVTVQKNGETEAETYEVPFCEYSSDGKKTKTPFDVIRNHYYEYEITGVGKTFAYTAAIKPWGTYTKEVNIVVEKFHWLYVKNKVLYMNNVDEITTTFNSSTSDLTCTVSDVYVYNTTTEWSSNDPAASAQQQQVGNITITSPIPDNFVGKQFRVTVSSATSGKSETIQVYQFPQLYISYETTNEKWKDDNNQQTTEMFTFNALMADLSALPTPDSDDYYTGNYNQSNGNYYYKYYKENNSNKLRWDLKDEYVEYLKTEAVFGYPQTTTTVMSGTTTGYSETTNFKDVSVLTTVDSDENNRLISPSFMLASQAGMNSPSKNYDDKVDFCKRYKETAKGNPNVTYGPGCWRLPTTAEVKLIDVLQNVSKCAVNAILEGGAYWSSDATAPVVMMDPRTGNGYDSAAVRCVRDIK